MLVLVRIKGGLKGRISTVKNRDGWGRAAVVVERMTEKFLQRN